ncbi:MAG: nitrite reductase, copper-containing [Chloroflexota bacterium]|nr:nitrite reductase, copper-containing [Chloroflexota bacterium]
MSGLTQRLELPRTETLKPERSGSEAQASGVLGAILGALGMSMAAALVVAVLAATGGIRSGAAAPAAAGQATTAAQPATDAMPGMAMGGTQTATTAAAIAAAKPVTVKSIAQDATAVPPAITRTSPTTVSVQLQAKEVIAEIAPGQTYNYWTFNGAVPGPMLRVRVGDTVTMHISNASGDAWPHSIDMHAVAGAGGGATASQTQPGGTSDFSFKALTPGLFIYHCASAPIPEHIANGMYGMILVEPEGGFSKVDHEFYVMQSELYTNAPAGVAGNHEFSQAKMDAEQPDYIVMNGAMNALTGDHAMKAKVGDTVRIYFGVGGFLPSSLHLIGGVFDKVYPEAGGVANTNVQTTLVPAGGATIVELHFTEPGTYTLVDHSLPRAMDKGAMAQIVVSGTADPAIYSGPSSGGGH